MVILLYEIYNYFASYTIGMEQFYIRSKYTENHQNIPTVSYVKDTQGKLLIYKE